MIHHFSAHSACHPQHSIDYSVGSICESHEGAHDACLLYSKKRLSKQIPAYVCSHQEGGRSMSSYKANLQLEGKLIYRLN